MLRASFQNIILEGEKSEKNEVLFCPLKKLYSHYTDYWVAQVSKIKTCLFFLLLC